MIKKVESSKTLGFYSHFKCKICKAYNEEACVQKIIIPIYPFLEWVKTSGISLSFTHKIWKEVISQEIPPHLFAEKKSTKCVNNSNFFKTDA